MAPTVCRTSSLPQRGDAFMARRVRFREDRRHRPRHAHSDVTRSGGGTAHEHRPLDSTSSSALNYLPMTDASLEYANEQFSLHVNSDQYKCLCGTCHVVLGTKLFLVFYVVLTAFGVAFGMLSAMVWIGIPFGVTVMTVYGFCRQKHKYFYPFLIISVVQLMVCLIMGLVVAAFSIVNYDTLKMILTHNLPEEPSTTTIIAIVGITVFTCGILAIMHVWQVMVIYRCLQYYEYDLRPDRVLISGHGDKTDHGLSLFESTQQKQNVESFNGQSEDSIPQRRVEFR